MQEESFPRGRGERTEKVTDDSKKQRGRSKERQEASSPKKRPNDFLFGGPEKDSKTKKSSKKRKKSVDAPSKAETSALSSKSLMPLGGGGVAHPAKGEGWIESLGFNKLAKGFKLLGCVREVHEDLAILSLPNLWTAFMMQEDVPCNAMLSVGQMVSVVIVRAVQEHTKDGVRRRIQVSCLPSAINPPGAIGAEGSSLSVTDTTVRCQVRSIEDHGILMDLGANRRGFLPFSEIKEDYTIEEGEEDEEDDFVAGQKRKLRLTEGRIVDCLVRSSSTKATGVLPLCLPSRRSMAKQSVPLTYTPTLAQLKPGMLVHTKVETLLRNGLCVSFCNDMFRGAIELQHLGSYWIPQIRHESTKWKDIFNNQRSLMARIIAVDPATKIVRLSLQPHILEMKPDPEALPAVGTVIEGATVIRLDAGIGALLALPSSTEKGGNPRSFFKPISEDESYLEASRVKAVFVHISKAIDAHGKGKKTPEALFAKEFAPSTTHTVRILNTSNWIDGIASGATARRIVDAHVLTHADLETGKVYKQVPVCAQLDNGGVLVDFGMGVRGLIPELHLFDTAVKSDYRQQMRKVKYSVGAKVDVRVLKIDPRSKRCLLSAKKSIIMAERIIQYFDEVRVGDIGTGFVSKVEDRGLSVTFFNGVYGRVTARSLSLELGIEDHRQNYAVGDVVECKVTNIKKKAKRGSSRIDCHDSDEEMDADDTEEGTGKRRYKQLTLSLKLDGDNHVVEDDDHSESGEHSSALASRIVQLRVGALLPVKSMRVVELVKGRAKDDGYVPGYAIVNIKSKYLVDEAESATTVPYFECKLPYDQLLDSYEEEDVKSPAALDSLAETILTAGKKVDKKGFILLDPKKSKSEFHSGTGKLTVVSIRPKLVDALERQLEEKEQNDAPLLPDPTANLFKGAQLVGYVANIDKRHGSFVRYLNGLTGLVPKMKGGLLLPMYGTVETEVLAIDVTASPPKLLVTTSVKKGKKGDIGPLPSIKAGDVINEATITKLDFHRAALKIADDKMGCESKIKARVHCTMAASKSLHKAPKSHSSATGQKISKLHPFYKWKVGQKLTKLRVVSVEVKGKKWFVELTNRDKSETNEFVEKVTDLTTGQKISGIVSSVVPGSGLWVEVSPAVTCHIPALEVSTDIKILNTLANRFPVGCRVDFAILDKSSWRSVRNRYNLFTPHKSKQSKHSKDHPFGSMLSKGENAVKPDRGDLVVGRVNRSLHPTNEPALMLDLRGGFVARCCITELEEHDDWANLPLGRSRFGARDEVNGKPEDDDASGGSGDEMDVDETDHDANKRADDSLALHGQFPHGEFVICRVLNGVPSKPLVEVSLRASRIEGDLDNDEKPEVGAKVQAYVVSTTNKGCFVRLARQIEGRVILKELCDGFLPNPVAAFPPGRLVVGKVKNIKSMKKKNNSKTVVDLDMRESVLLENEEKTKFQDIEVGQKFKGTVTRIEDYGVFVRLESSGVSGLVHKSECSDNYIKNLASLYDPGDLVKVLVLKKDDESKKIGFSMKASHFDGDEESDNDVSMEDEEESAAEDEEAEIDSDDEDYVTKLAESMKRKKSNDDDDDDDDDLASDSESESSRDSMSGDDDAEGENEEHRAMDTNVGFDWGSGGQNKSGVASSESDEDDGSSSESESEDEIHKSSHKSRRKQAQRRREEQEIARREMALADGTADENPETAADFERLLASSPNSSELWIKYMAFHLSLADIAAAREVADRAFGRIEFREEREKLNVWCALLTLELKYGTEAGLQKTVDRACQQNNPKHVYLRVCEMLEKDAATSGSSERTDEMYSKMCKKFRSKKKVWLAHMEYLLKNGRQEDAHTLSKRAVQSLPPYKHVETMSKFAQLVFEHGSPERARTLFDGLLLKYPKRLDLFFVYADKEVKHGEIAAARGLFEKVSNPADETLKLKLSDKQMKSFFKKWYAFEEQHGSDDTQETVKDAARQYVERSLSG